MRIVTVAGTRPDFVKVAPLLREMRGRPGIHPILVHTGQHEDALMSDRFFEDLGIPPPDANLGVGSGSHAAQTAEVMRRLEPWLLEVKPDRVLVVGDVNSTLAAALTSAKLGIPVDHVEAGLRSFDRTMPEEINRVVTDALADLHFVTEESGRANLLREGIAADQIHLVGNVMIDALRSTRHRWGASPIFERLGLSAGGAYAILTLHRPANVDVPGMLGRILAAVRRVARRLPVLFPVHPRARIHLRRYVPILDEVPARERAGPARGIVCLGPLGYLDFMALMSRARLVLTDSGGVQEETTALGIPCLTLRDTTERPITVTHGTNRLVGSEPERIEAEALRALERPLPPGPPPPLWDGRASERIVRILASGEARGGIGAAAIPAASRPEAEGGRGREVA